MGYGKFEYTREGVNQTTGVCLCCKADKARIDYRELSLQLEKTHRCSGISQIHAGLLSDQCTVRRQYDRLFYMTFCTSSFQRYGS